MADLPPVVAVLRANISEFSAKMGEARGEVAKMNSEGSGHFNQLAAVGKGALLGLGGVAIGVGGFALKMADDFEQSHARLVNAVRNAHESFSQLQVPLNTTEKSLEKFGFTNADVENALSRLIPVTKTGQQALGEMGLAADIARARHMSLEDATAILVKVQTGHVALLGRLGIATKDASGKTIDQATALKRLSDMYGGAAKTNAETFAGKMQGLKAAASDMGKNLGMLLIPMLEKVATVIADVTRWFNAHRPVAEALAAVIGGVLVAAVGAFTVGLFTAGGALAFLLSPVTLVVIGIAALVAGVIYAYNHFAIFREIVQAVASAVGTAIDWIGDHWKLLAVIIATVLTGPIALVAAGLMYLYNRFEVFRDAVQVVWQVIQTVTKVWWDLIVGEIRVAVTIISNVISVAWAYVYGVFKTTWDLITGIIRTVWQYISDVIRTAVDLVKGIIQVGLDIITGHWSKAWNDLKDAVGRVGGDIVKTVSDLFNNVLNTIGGFFTDIYNAGLNLAKALINGIINGISNLPGEVGGAIGGALSHIPGGGAVKGLLGLAEGGIVTGPTFALIGEGGRAEGVIPAGDPQRAAEILAGLGYLSPFSSLTSGATGGSAGPTVGASFTANITIVQQPGQSSGDLARAVQDALFQMARNGIRVVPAR